MIPTKFLKIQGWRNTFNFKLSTKERLPSKISAILRFHLAVQPIKDVFGYELTRRRRQMIYAAGEITDQVCLDSQVFLSVSD